MFENDKNGTVVIVGRNYGNILSMVRSFGEAGYKVEVLRVFRSKLVLLNPLNRMKPEKYSKYVRQYRECIATNGGSEVVCSHLMGMAKGDEGGRLLMAVDDHLLHAIETHREQLSSHYVIPGMPTGERSVTEMMDKALQKKLAATYDIPMLHGVNICVQRGEFQIPNTVNYPCFIKANVSMNGSKTKMARCEDAQELEAQIRNMAGDGDLEVLVEDFAEIRAEYSIIGLSVGGDVTSPGLIKSIVGGHRERAGVIILGELVADERFRAMIDKCNEFIRGIQYTGIFDIDLIETKSGKIYFVELNMRPGASTFALIKGGVNLAGMYADAVFQGMPIDTQSVIEEDGIKFVSEKNLYEEYLRGDISREDVETIMNEGKICFVKDDMDMKPYEYFKKQCKRNAFMKSVYRLKR